MKFLILTGKILTIILILFFSLSLLALIFTKQFILSLIFLVLLILSVIGLNKLNKKELVNNSKNKKDIKISKRKENTELEIEVAGTFLEERQNLIRRFIKDEIKDGIIIAYDGISNSDIKKNYKNIEVYEAPENYVWNEGYIELIKEPENEFDKNAIKVILIDYGHIGYIPKEFNAKLLNFLDKTKVKMAIIGGKYKIYDGESVEIDEEDYNVFLKIFKEV